MRHEDVASHGGYGNTVREPIDIQATTHTPLRVTKVVPADMLHPLREAYIKRDVLRQHGKLPPFPISDPYRASWDIPPSRGRSPHPDFRFYLEELVRVSERAVDGATLDTVKGLYKQLDARFRHDEHEADLRQASRVDVLRSPADFLLALHSGKGVLYSFL